MPKQLVVGVVGHYWTSNFGDILIRDLMCDFLKKECDISEVRTVTERAYNSKPGKLGKLLYILSFAISCDFVVFGGGGYLESRSSGYKNTQLLISFALLTLLLRLQGKSYCISAPGVGPDVSGAGGWLIRYICSGAEHVDVRDSESKEILKNIGTLRHISVCADAALVSAEFTNIAGTKKKRVALHLMLRNGEYRANKEAFAELVETIPQEYEIWLISDNGPLGEEIELINSCERQLNVYLGQEPLDFAKFLASCAFVVTTKLHVGIVSYVVKASVFNIYRHPKCLRFYRQVDKLDHCVSLQELSIDKTKMIVDLIRAGDNSGDSLEKIKEALVSASKITYEHVKTALLNIKGRI